MTEPISKPPYSYVLVPRSQTFGMFGSTRIVRTSSPYYPLPNNGAKATEGNRPFEESQSRFAVHVPLCEGKKSNVKCLGC